MITYLKKLNFFKHINIKAKIVVSFSILLVVTLLVIGIMSIYKYSRAMEKSTSQYSYQVIEQVIKNVEYYVNEMKSISNIANYNYYVQKYLKNTDSKYTPENYRDATEVVQLMDNIVGIRQDIVSIFIFGKNNSIISNNSNNRINRDFNFKRQQWFTDAEKNKGESVIIRPHKQSYVMDSSKLVISLSRSISSYDAKDTNQGVILIDLNLKVLDDICGSIKLGKEGYIFIIDSEGNIIYHPDYSYMYRAMDEMYIKNIFKEDDIIIPEVLQSDEGSYIKKLDSGKRQITYKKFKSTGWTVVGVSSYNESMREINKIRTFIIVIGIICLICAFAVSILISSMISKPVKRLESLMEEAEKGNLDVAIDFDSRDEIGMLSQRFNNMITKIKHLMEEVVIEQEAKRKTEFKALQAQINPHFLYNTLDSIIWMAEENKEEVVIMADALAKLFRLSLSKGEEIIPVTHEFEHVRNYLIIQSMRYANKFDYIIDLSPEIVGLKMLKLVLQPIVENSLYHGIKNKRQKGLIVIRGRIFEGKLLLQVMDDGIGMDEKKCKEILVSRSSSDSRKGFNGVGVKNVNERIKLYYGQEFGLEFISSPGVGTVVEIMLPLS